MSRPSKWKPSEDVLFSLVFEGGDFDKLCPAKQTGLHPQTASEAFSTLNANRTAIHPTLA